MARRRTKELSRQKAPDLRDPALYLNRELSMLEFNRRVLAQARDSETPLMERLRFLTICSTNLDEFFEVRVAGIKQQVAFGLVEPGPDGRAPIEALELIASSAQQLVVEQYRVLNEELIPAMEAEGISILRRSQVGRKQRVWIENLFKQEVLPVLTPIGIDPAHPFPRVLNKGLSFLVTVVGKDAFHRDSGIAVLQAPRALPRLLRLPRALGEHEHTFVLLSSIIHEHAEELFPGMLARGCFQFRVTRNSDLWVDEEEVENLLHALKGQLPGRRFGEAVRLEVADTCPPEVSDLLLENVGLDERDLYRVNGPVNLNRLAAIYDHVDRPDLKFPTYNPVIPRRLAGSEDIFETIRASDILLHHPFDSFTPIVHLVQQAARDPAVLAIKQTLYRTETNSPMTEALIEAAAAGKEVTAVVELRARFDEAANIDLATRLQEAGASVAYGVVGYKAHAKMLMIVRREGDELKRYVHLGTGNYHSGTARAYTDIGLLTCDTAIAADVHVVFQQMTGLGRLTPLARLLQSPFTLHREILRLIHNEAELARAGEPARILARMNSLSEPTVIAALYEASRAGVEIDLVVRGICCLRPGVPGISDRIRVRSIVGRFLEHVRVFYFLNGGEQLTLCSSADWMHRNLLRRVEVAFPIEDPELRDQVIDEAFHVYLEDNCQAWELTPDGSYRRLRPRKKEGTRRAQQRLCQRRERAQSTSAGHADPTRLTTMSDDPPRKAESKGA